MSPKESSGGFRDEVKKFEADKGYDDRGCPRNLYGDCLVSRTLKSGVLRW